MLNGTIICGFNAAEKASKSNNFSHSSTVIKVTYHIYTILLK